MTVAADNDTERFEQQLARQQAQRRKLVRGAAWALVAGGAIGVLLGFVLGWPPADKLPWFLSFIGLGGAALAAGAVVLLRERSAAAGSAVDDLINRLAPRILGGAKPEKLDDHQRRRRSRRHG